MFLVALKNANLALAFLLELCVLAALGYWGFQTGQGILFKILLGIGAPVLAIIVWGWLGAPKSTTQLQGIWYWVLKVVFFGSAIVALFLAQQRTLGTIFAIVFIINCVLILIWHQ